MSPCHRWPAQAALSQHCQLHNPMACLACMHACMKKGLHRGCAAVSNDRTGCRISRLPIISPYIASNTTVASARTRASCVVIVRRYSRLVLASNYHHYHRRSTAGLLASSRSMHQHTPGGGSVACAHLVHDAAVSCCCRNPDLARSM
jgi:hypothetical protein